MSENHWTLANIKTDYDNIYHLSRAIFLAFARSERVILEMSLKKGTLEDIFIELSEAAPEATETGPDEDAESEVKDA